MVYTPYFCYNEEKKHKVKKSGVLPVQEYCTYSTYIMIFAAGAVIARCVDNTHSRVE